MAKLIVFDMDGVLFDTTELMQSHFIGSHPGVTEEMYRNLYVGNVHEEAQKLEHLALPETEEEKTKRYAAYAQAKSKAPLFDGMGELLKDLHASGVTLALSTNAYEQNCVPVLERAGVKGLFDFIAPAEVSKSKVEKFRMIEERYGRSAGEMLFVTDTLGDVREADEAGVPTIAVTWGLHDESYFAREPHDNLAGIVHAVSELRERLFANTK